MKLSKKEQEELLILKSQDEDFWKFNKIQIYFGTQDYKIPDGTGTIVHSRYSYPKHWEFFEAGKTFNIRAVISANRTGKSLAGCYEDCVHATGKYPVDWPGRRFTRPVQIWICGDRGEAVRDSLQVKLWGELGSPGTGLLPVGTEVSAMSGIPGGIGVYKVPHVSGGFSVITVKTYQAGRTAFEGATCDIIHLDEECPRDIFSECLTRMATTNGMIYLTFTPDSGLTDTLVMLLDNNSEFPKHITKITWDDVPHLTEQMKKIILAAYSPHERDCRTKGIPYLGRGKIYNINEDAYIIDMPPISRWWPRCYALDVGYAHPTAAVWAAWDREDDIIYIYSEYRASRTEVSSHANAILARGKWIPGVIDNSSNQESAVNDGIKLIDMYQKFGISPSFVKKGKGSREAGILEVYDRLESGRLKISNKCQMLIDEIRLYRRDDNGKIIKDKDDLLDALRYLVTNGLYYAITEPNEDDSYKNNFESSGRSKIGGY